MCCYSGLLCKVSAGNDVACLTTNHLAALARLEPRLVPLVLAFRYWAQVRFHQSYSWLKIYFFFEFLKFLRTVFSSAGKDVIVNSQLIPQYLYIF